MASNKAVIGIVATQPQAEMIVVELHRSQFRTDDVSLLFPDRGASRDFAHETATDAPERAATGASAADVLGGTLTLLSGIRALPIAGLGSFIAAGPIVAVLSGAATGAAVGGVTSALIDFGIPELEAKSYESKLKDGSILISVHTDDAEMRKRARGIMERNSATDVATVGEDSVPQHRASVPTLI